MTDANGPQFVLSGQRSGSDTPYQGEYGHYWSSSAGQASLAYFLNVYNAGVMPAHYYNKYAGLTVRCLAK